MQFDGLNWSCTGGDGLKVVASGIKSQHFDTTSNCTPFVTTCTFPAYDRLQCSSTMKHLTAHAIAQFDLTHTALYLIPTQTSSALPH